MRGLIYYDKSSSSSTLKKQRNAKISAAHADNSRIEDIELNQQSSCNVTSAMNTVSIAHQTKILPQTEEENRYKSADINNDESKIQILNQQSMISLERQDHSLLVSSAPETPLEQTAEDRGEDDEERNNVTEQAEAGDDVVARRHV